MASFVEMLVPPKQTGTDFMDAVAPNAQDDMLGYKIRDSLHPGEDDYFRKNPHVTGMAAETGDIILNPYAPANVNKNAVAKNEALRLFMRDKNINPNFAITPEQRAQFSGTPYGSDDNALRQTIAARIYSGDPSALASEEQKQFTNMLIQQARGAK